MLETIVLCFYHLLRFDIHYQYWKFIVYVTCIVDFQWILEHNLDACLNEGIVVPTKEPTAFFSIKMSMNVRGVKFYKQIKITFWIFISSWNPLLAWLIGNPELISDFFKLNPEAVFSALVCDNDIIF